MGDCQSRKEKQREQQRAYIMDVALNLFSEYGYHEVSMQQIAEASEYSVGSLYNYFSNKDTLFETILDRSRDAILQILLPTLQSDSPPDQRLKIFINTLPDIVKAHGHAIRLYITMHGQKLSTKSLPEMSQDFRIRLMNEVQRTISEGIESNLFKPVPPRMTALSLFVTQEAAIFEFVDGVCDETPEDIVQQIEELFLNNLLK